MPCSVVSSILVRTCPKAINVSSAVWWSSMCRSPLVRNRRLQPPCFARACSMWSRKPMPVSTLICCDFDDCDACSLPSPLVSASSTAGNAPPSRLSDNWIFVSFVSRLIVAERMRLSDDIFGRQFLAVCNVNGNKSQESFGRRDRPLQMR